MRKDFSNSPRRERIPFTKELLLNTKKHISFSNGVYRYLYIRRWCYGHVIDAACGVGYGSTIIAENPEVDKVTGYDISSEAITEAKTNFEGGKVSFHLSALNQINVKADTFVCLETIEHLDDLNDFSIAIQNSRPSNVIVSYPDKKSTHFNAFHKHDLRISDVTDLIPNYIPYRKERYNDVTILFFVEKPATMPAHYFRNILEL